MVTEDYSFNVTYLQDLGFALWTPGRTGPLFLVGRGRFVLLGLFFVYGPTYGCLFLNPISFDYGGGAQKPEFRRLSISNS